MWCHYIHKNVTTAVKSLRISKNDILEKWHLKDYFLLIRKIDFETFAKMHLYFDRANSLKVSITERVLACVMLFSLIAIHRVCAFENKCFLMTAIKKLDSWKNGSPQEKMLTNFGSRLMLNLEVEELTNMKLALESD
jgi:hypothetical protein